MSLRELPGRLFGTDGVRGRVGGLLDAELALALGRAAAGHCGGATLRVLIARDTRRSGPMLEAAFAAGLAAGGAEALLAGVLPTPAVPMLLEQHGCNLGAVISASHNPYEDNGIKLFGADGFKLGDSEERAIEALLRAHWERSAEPLAAQEVGVIGALHGCAEDYARRLTLRFGDLDLAGRRVALDCANGATHAIAPDLFRRLGAEVQAIGCAPDGRNINAGCGSTHVEALQELVRGGEAEIGFAFDGDGDRVLAVDGAGELVDGDELMGIIALHRLRAGSLRGGVAVTVMSNFGLHVALGEAGIEIAQTGVGDRLVLEELRRREWSFGGEQSGHIIDLQLNCSGDGIASALLTLEALGERPLRAGMAMKRLPQRLINVAVNDRDALGGAAAVREACREAERELSGSGRVLIRASGTEPLVRVMVEAPSERQADEICQRLARMIAAELG